MSFSEALSAMEARASEAGTFVDQAQSSIESMVAEAMSAPYSVITGLGGSVPNITVPKAPTMDTSLGDVKFDDDLLMVMPTLPEEYRRLLDDFYPATDWAALIELLNELSSPAWLAAKRAQMRGQLERELADRITAVQDRFSMFGFSMPQGAMTASLTALERTAQDKITEADLALYAEMIGKRFDALLDLAKLYAQTRAAEVDAWAKLVSAYLSALETNYRTQEYKVRLEEARANLKTKVFELQASYARLQIDAESLKVQANDSLNRATIAMAGNNAQVMQTHNQTRVHALNMAANHYASLLAAAQSQATAIVTGVGYVEE